MSVIQTNKWLLEYYEEPIKLCEKLTGMFDNIAASHIYHYLIQHGMYQRPTKQGMKQVKQLINHEVWEVVKKEERKLKALWDGPNIPIFIFPSESTSRQMKRDYNGKSGLTFKDKLFLFVSEENTEKEIRALFTHEYNHACRLSKINKQMKDFVLLDTIIMEGLAENAVKERIGKDYLALWTTYYSDKQLEEIWKSIIIPHQEMPAYRRKHHDILYGFKLYPKMAGYCAGYYLVQRYLEQNSSLSSKELLSMPSTRIAEIEET